MQGGQGVFECAHAFVQAHTLLYVVRSFIDHLSTVADAAVAIVMRRICQLYVVHALLKHVHYVTDVSACFVCHMLQDGYMSLQQVQIMQQHRLRLLAELRPDAVALVDSWMHRYV